MCRIGTNNVIISHRFNSRLLTALWAKAVGAPAAADAPTTRASGVGGIGFTREAHPPGRGGIGHPQCQRQTSRAHQRARMRYLSTEVPSLATGTLNCAAQASVLVHL